MAGNIATWASNEALYAAAKPLRSRAMMAAQQASAAAASARTLGSVISFPSTTLHPGRRGNIGIMQRWSSSQRRTASSQQVSIFSGQKRLSYQCRQRPGTQIPMASWAPEMMPSERSGSFSKQKTSFASISGSIFGRE